MDENMIDFETSDVEVMIHADESTIPTDVDKLTIHLIKGEAETITDVELDTSSFNNLLSKESNTVQKAMNELDQSVKPIDGLDILNLFN